MIIICFFLLLQAQQPEGAKYYVYLGEIGELQIKVSIWGEIKSPGLYSIPEGMDLATFLTLAGGLLKGADMSGIKVVRSFPEAKVFSVNLSKFFKTGRREDVPVLNPGDMIYIKGNFYSRIKEFTHFLTETTFLIGAYYGIYRLIRGE
ncbi:SLBB domain-containing protein [candidate division WOR-3 bacterium]|nr:SLBB domain-containing protein [candidate division WOR-3 bacterium]